MRLIAVLFATLVCAIAHAQTPIRFALDWRFEGPAAPYFVAIDKGYYNAEGLDVTVDSPRNQWGSEANPGSPLRVVRPALANRPSHTALTPRRGPQRTTPSPSCRQGIIATALRLKVCRSRR